MNGPCPRLVQFPSPASERERRRLLGSLNNHTKVAETQWSMRENYLQSTGLGNMEFGVVKKFFFIITMSGRSTYTERELHSVQFSAQKS